VTGRIFLLSPASASGERAQLLIRTRARFDLALRLRASGASIGEVFSFLSGLYFRGKLAYAERFAAHTPRNPRVFVITPGAGLRIPETTVTLADLRRFARIEIDASNPRYARPLERDARALARNIEPKTEIVLLGSIATSKYTDVMLPVFGPRLLFPPAFVGRGDMSRGGLLLRASRAGEELIYRPIEGSPRRGARPPKLPRP
jgi:hypothetical protein